VRGLDGGWWWLVMAGDMHYTVSGLAEIHRNKVYPPTDGMALVISIIIRHQQLISGDSGTNSPELPGRKMEGKKNLSKYLG
jgi:hypothetical protein